MESVSHRKAEQNGIAYQGHVALARDGHSVGEAKKDESNVHIVPTGDTGVSDDSQVIPVSALDGGGLTGSHGGVQNFDEKTTATASRRPTWARSQSRGSAFDAIKKSSHH